MDRDATPAIVGGRSLPFPVLVQSVWRLEGPHVLSPNMRFLPCPPTGRVDVRLQDDGRFGIHDPVVWPQLWFPELPHYAAMPIPPAKFTAAESSCNEPPWYTPPPGDFLALPGDHLAPMGLLADTAWARLCDIFHQNLAPRIASFLSKHEASDSQRDRVASLRHFEVIVVNAMKRLSWPATYRDLIKQVAHFQRLYLECSAWITWTDSIRPTLDSRTAHEPRDVISGIMGAFTQDVDVCQRLSAAGVPVWLVTTRPVPLPDTVPMSTEYKCPPAVPALFGSRPIPEARLSGATPAYVGVAGPRHLAAIWRKSRALLDVSDVYASAEEDDAAASTSTSKRAKGSSGSGTSSAPAPCDFR